MNLQLQSGPLDEASREDGDRYFLGVNERLAPQQLPAGLGSYAENCRFRRGKKEPRDGIAILPWGRGTDGLTPFNNPLGAVVFRDPVNPGEWILVADADGLWKTQPNNVATAVPLPAGTTITASNYRRMLQAMSVLLMQRGPDNDQLVCSDLDIGFRVINQTDQGDGTQVIPRSSFGLYYGNRTFFIAGRDGVAQSDIEDYTRYVEVQDTFKINAGEDDALTTIVPFGADSLVMGKQRRVWKVIGVSGDLSNAIGPLNVTQEYGVAGPDAMVEYDSQLYWWTGNELASARLTETAEQETQTILLSENLEKTFGRLNAVFGTRVQLKTWRKKLYVAFPADEAWILSAERVIAGQQYDGSGHKSYGTTAGRKYLINDLGSASSVVNGTQTLTGPGLVTAQGSTIVFHGTAFALVTGSFKQVLHEGVNNLVAVYDFVTDQWAGVDVSNALCVTQWFKFNYVGREQLGFIGADGYLRGYELGADDEQVVSGAIVPLEITDTFWTRGYTAMPRYGSGFQDSNRFVAAVAKLSTFAPGYSLSTATNGVNNVAPYTVTGTRDRGKYDAPVGTADYDISNVHDDAEVRGRQDYSVLLDGPNLFDGVTLDGSGNSDYLPVVKGLTYTWVPAAGELLYGQEVLPNGDINSTLLSAGEFTAQDTVAMVGGPASSAAPGELYLTNAVEPGSGIALDRMQDSTERVPIDERGDWMQLRFTNTGGRLEVREVMLEALDRDRPGGMLGQ